MYIFHVSWAYGGYMGLNAVVAAFTERQALDMLNLSDEDKCQKTTIIGTTLLIAQPIVFAHESV